MFALCCVDIPANFLNLRRLHPTLALHQSLYSSILVVLVTVSLLLLLHPMPWGLVGAELDMKGMNLIPLCLLSLNLLLSVKKRRTSVMNYDADS